MTTPPPLLGVSFDFGQTLASLDCAYLAQKLGERGSPTSDANLEGALGSAWAAYDQAVRAGVCGHPWKLFMKSLLSGAGLDRSPALDDDVDFLWNDQPHRNLWRRPISGMIDLARSLSSRGLRIGVLTNSEGRAAELIDELGWGGVFDVIVDSGRVRVEKPDPRIFQIFAQQLGVPIESILHLGDSLGADVHGARRAGMRALWFRPETLQSVPPADPNEPFYQTAAEVERVIDALLNHTSSIATVRK